jgi:formate/nitrite transporter FocA (FNT family)
MDKRIGFGALMRNWTWVYIGNLLGDQLRAVAGRVVAMWLPITTFFAHGYERSIVNMFAILAGMMLGAKPVTPGNMVGGASLTGIALWLTHVAKAAEPELAAPLASGTDL